MNYLAHIYLSGDQPTTQIGGLLGDFIKGPLDAQLHAPFYPGLLLHRRIDAHLDALEEFRDLLSSFEPQHRRFAGILLDILFDHFLASEWPDDANQPLEEFCESFYRELNKHYQALPKSAQHFANRAPAIQWLQNYRDFENLHPMLQRVSQRFSRQVALQDAIPHLQHNYDFYRSGYRSIFPQISVFAEKELRNILKNI